MTNVVINKCFGGFGISVACIERIAQLRGQKLYPERISNLFTKYWVIPPEDRIPDVDWETTTPEQRREHFEVFRKQYICDSGIDRDDPALVQAVRELGEAANAQYAQLVIINIPDDVEYTIEEYDGTEHIAEVHRTWG